MPSQQLPAVSTSSRLFGENNKGVRFQIRTKGATWQCTLQDRATYERVKASMSSDSVDSETSSTHSTSSN